MSSISRCGIRYRIDSNLKWNRIIHDTSGHAGDYYGGSRV